MTTTGKPTKTPSSPDESRERLRKAIQADFEGAFGAFVEALNNNCGDKIGYVFVCADLRDPESDSVKVLTATNMPPSLTFSVLYAGTEALHSMTERPDEATGVPSEGTVAH